MNTLNLSPLLRSTIGFDHLGRYLNAYYTDGYPPYNIEKQGDDAYSLRMAVAGFTIDELDIVVNDNTITVKGRSKSEEKDKVYLYRSIAAREFQRTFQLADYIRVANAHLVDGILTIDLVREVPEHKKPRQIAISSTPTTVQ